MFEHYIIDALDIIANNWELPDEQLADAIIDRARQLAGIDSDQPWEDRPEIH